MAERYLPIRTHAPHCRCTETGRCVCRWADENKGPIMFMDERGGEWALQLVSLNQEAPSRAATPEILARLGYRNAANVRAETVAMCKEKARLRCDRNEDGELWEIYWAAVDAAANGVGDG
jgi:hypothetical protein